MLILNIDAWKNYVRGLRDMKSVMEDDNVIHKVFKDFKACFESNNAKSTELLNLICTELPKTLSVKLDYRNPDYEKGVTELEIFVGFLLNNEVNRILVYPLYAVMNKNLDEKQISSCMFTIENLGDIERIDVSNYQYLHDVDLIDLVSYAGYHHFIGEDAMNQYHKVLTMDTFSLISSVMAGKKSGKDIAKIDDIPQIPQTMLKLDIPGRDAILDYFERIVNLDTEYTNVFKLIDLINPSNYQDFGDCNRFMTNHVYDYYSLYYRVLNDIVNMRGFKKQEKCILKLIDYTKNMYVESKYHALAGMMMRLCMGVIFLLGFDQPYARSPKFKPYYNMMKLYKRSDIEYESTDLLGAMLVCAETQSTMLEKVKNITCLHESVSSAIVDRSTDEGLQESVEDGFERMISPSHLMTTLTETFEVLRDGTIKVTLPEKTTFMNEYAVNHRLLKYNDQHGDYEGMKYNLVYHMILIENIEKNVLYNPRVKKDSELYKDAQKAHSFAKNDISIYLPKVKGHDRGFDLNKFYKKIKADKATVTINGVETALGLKKIFSSILLR